MNLIEWLRKALVVWQGLLSFLLCVAFSGILLSLDSPGRLVFHQVMIGTVFYPVQAVLSRFQGTVRIHRENERLRRENAALRAENDLLNQSLRQTPRLEEMERFYAAESLRLKPGRIVAEDAGRLRRTWVVDLGLADSVEVNMPVMTSRGVVGKVAKSFRHHSVVQLLSDPGFKASVQSDRGRARGILESYGGFRLAARFPAGSDVRAGDTLVTAGLGGVFPKGLRLGRTGPGAPPDGGPEGGVLLSFPVEPFQSLNAVEEVFVLLKRDQWTLEREAP